MPNPRKPDPEKYCLQCGARMFRKRFASALQSRNIFLAAKFCSSKCQFAWKKPTAKISAIRRRATKVKGNKCEICGSTHRVAAHHCDEDIHNNARENIQTLCNSCHSTHHHFVRALGRKPAGRMERFELALKEPGKFRVFVDMFNGNIEQLRSAAR